MAASVIFHKLVQRDVTGVLRYYADEADEALADRFYDVLTLVKIDGDWEIAAKVFVSQ